MGNDRKRYPLPVLSLDFDGVLHSFSTGWQGVDVASDPPTPGAMEFLREALNHFTVCIFSSRSEHYDGLEAMLDWTISNYAKHFNLTYTQAAEELRPIRWPTTKPHAHVSLDDRAIQFNGTWPSVQEIKDFKPWNRR